MTKFLSMFRSSDGKNYLGTFALVTTLFFLWAFCNSMIDTMDKHFQDLLHLTRSQSAWVQFAHYLGYFLIALPAGWIAQKLGYRRGIITGLLLVSLGGFWFIPATHIAQFWAFLLGVCIVAMGLTFLETIANPYTTVLGDKKFAASRINLAQSFNGLGWPLGPIVGGMFFYSESGSAEAANQTLYIPYLGIAIFVLIIAALFMIVPLPELNTEDAYGNDNSHDKHIFSKDPAIWTLVLIVVLSLLEVNIYRIPKIAESHHEMDFIIHVASFLIYIICATLIIKCLYEIYVNYKNSIWSLGHFSSAVAAQFFYVAAQAGIFSFFINYIVSDTPAVPACLRDSFLIGGAKGIHEQAGGLAFFSDKGATSLLSAAFLFFVAGRFTGAWLLSLVRPHILLGTYSVISAVLCGVVLMKLGWISVAALFLIFFFLSVGFPTIFALGIWGLGKRAKIASAYIVMAIMGGAIMPKLMGWLSDTYGVVSGWYGRVHETGHNDQLMTPGFAMPLLCFLVIALYAFNWARLSGNTGEDVAVSSGGH